MNNVNSVEFVMKGDVYNVLLHRAREVKECTTMSNKYLEYFLRATLGCIGVRIVVEDEVSRVIIHTNDFNLI